LNKQICINRHTYTEVTNNYLNQTRKAKLTAHYINLQPCRC